MALVWSEARFATGIDIIDAQHRTMFSMADELLDAVRRSCPEKQVGKLLDALAQAAGKHFACEEDIMERRKCSACVANKLAHRWFLEDLDELRGLLERDGVGERLFDEIDERVCHWFEAHLLAIDMTLRTDAVDRAGREERGGEAGRCARSVAGGPLRNP